MEARQTYPPIRPKARQPTKQITEETEQAYRGGIMLRHRSDRGVPAGVVGACAPAEEVPRDELRRPPAVRPARHEPHRFSRHLLVQREQLVFIYYYIAQHDARRKKRIQGNSSVGAGGVGKMLLGCGDGEGGER
jgi:hypothetical protein